MPLETTRDTWPNRDLSQSVQAGGIRWHIQQIGSGPRLLLVHGTGASAHSWRDLLRPLGEHFTVLAVDLPGHAFTDPGPAGGSGINGMSELLGSLLDELRFSPDYVAGHSAGAVILCRLALTGRIVPRVIISINGAFLPLRGLAGFFFSPLAKLLGSNSVVPQILAHRASDAARVERVLLSTGSSLDAQGVALYCRLVRDPRHLSGALRMMGSWDLHAFESELAQLQTPLAMIVAENDHTVPPQQAQTIRSRVKNALIVSLPQLGHLAHEEAPQLLVAQIVRISGLYPAK